MTSIPKVIPPFFMRNENGGGFVRKVFVGIDNLLREGRRLVAPNFRRFRLRSVKRDENFVNL